MIDILAILASCGLLVVIVRRAIRLDKSLPWFAPLRGGKSAEPPNQLPPGAA
jgi:hypothetical protein